MSLPVAFTRAAEAEFDADHNWYENNKTGRGRRFREAVQKTLDRVAANPLMHAQVYGDVRRAVVSKFPYIVLYIPEVTQIVVIAIFHTSRDPSEWQRRV